MEQASHRNVSHEVPGFLQVLSQGKLKAIDLLDDDTLQLYNRVGYFILMDAEVILINSVYTYVRFCMNINIWPVY